jgi:type II restriction enzyme
MSEHSKEQFNSFMRQLKGTNRSLNFYCDFGKISRNVRNIAINLNTLNYLLTVKNLKQGVEDIWGQNPQAFNVLGILVAIRDDTNELVLNDLGAVVKMNDYYKNSQSVYNFIVETGLSNVFLSHQITNLVDYVFGIETGLDTNARKNRSGVIMENTIGSIFTRFDIPFSTQVSSKKYPDLKGLGTDEKVFDFSVSTKEKTYLIEVNFYSSGGSKLNEVARSYSELSPVINNNPKYEFVWITDGIGWNQASNKLEQAFNIISNIYNLTTIDQFISQLKSEGF